jgi:hypothetical protein
MLASTEAFLEPLERWIRAVRQDDFGSARLYAEHLDKAGEALAMHPDFQRCFNRRCEGSDPKHILTCMSQFLLCTTDGRATVAKQRGKDAKREPGR